MIRDNRPISDTAPKRRRSHVMPAFAGIGVLAGLVVAAWGSFFAEKTLYPSYLEAFQSTPTGVQTPRVVQRTLDEELGVGRDRRMVDANMDDPSASDTGKPDADLADAARVLADPDKRIDPVDPASVDPTAPETFARKSDADAGNRALASLADPRGSDAGPATIQSPDDVGLADMPQAEATPRPSIDVASIPRLRPEPRPGTVTVARTTAPTDATPEDATPEDELNITTSTMNSPSALAVLSSPRPRSVPTDLRMAALSGATTATQPTTQAAAPATTGNEATPVGLRTAPDVQTASRVRGKGCGRNHARNMPNRQGGMTSGSAFFASVGDSSGASRDNAIINQLARGNMPRFLQDLTPVVLRGHDSRGASTEIVVCVTPDYLALGSDQDFVRVPLGLPAASSIAGRFGMMLPTSRMVDAIYAQAPVKLNPKPMQAGPQMSSTTYFVRHNDTIEAQRSGRGGLIAGHKKDVVVANRMASNPGRVAIYGWHRSNGVPIQPVSTVHGASYADYSHGIRLVSRTAYLNGRAVNLEDLLSSSRYAYLLNSDGPLPGRVIQVASR